MENILEHRSRVGVADAILLEDFKHEDAFIENLRRRYQGRLIYTYIGQVLVSVNPYEELGIYSEENLEKYRSVNFFQVPPHVYAIAEYAYRSMLKEGRNQCILISGESGAGKTEASKHVLRFIAAASKHRSEGDKIRDRLLGSNPVLEAFGNARTNRNDNSSRFGKYMDIECDFMGDPHGGHVINYILEKSRVVHQEEGERNFHVFYQLLAGSSDELMQQLLLESRNPQSYYYLCQDKSKEDASNFKEVSSALDVIDFGPEEKIQMWKIISAILHLGNVQFITDHHGNAKISRENYLVNACQMLQCSEQELGLALTQKTIQAKEDVIISSLNVEQAYYARDALAKRIYELLFQWLVSRLNRSLQTDLKDQVTLIGILDIYGFEVFEKNGFEQFCINYCNEKLQQVFIELTLRSEQAEYEREGISWEQVLYFDNKIICDLIEERHRGIISFLDEECLRPGDSTDSTFLQKLDSNLASHGHYLSHGTSNNNKIKRMIGRDEFRLRHYAGDVSYCVVSFLDKNNDLLFRDLKAAMSNSRHPILTQVFPQKSVMELKRPDTVATQFKNSLRELMKILMSKEPSYIRCIKPNDFKLSNNFNTERVRHQVQYLGLMENLRVRRAGFAYRRQYEVFLARYKCLCPKTWPNFPGSPKEGVQVLVDYLNYSPQDYRMGNTKIFIRLPQTLFKTEDAFQLRKHELASKFQAIWKGKRQRLKFLRMVDAVTTISKNWKRVLAIRTKEKRKWASTVVRNFMHGFITRNDAPNGNNEKFHKFVKYSWLTKLSNCLPKSVIRHHHWPQPPAICAEASEILKNYHLTYLAREFVRNLSADRKTMFEEKILAEKLFQGRKVNYEASFPEWFETCRLSAEEHEQLKKLTLEESKILYSVHCSKLDRRSYRPRKRLLVLTPKALYLLEASKKKLKRKDRVPFKDITSITLSPNSDGLLLITIPIQNAKQDKGDLILNVPHVIEVATKIISATGNSEILKIITSASVEHSIKNGKSGTIQFDRGAVTSIHKAKDGKLVVVGRPLDK